MKLFNILVQHIMTEKVVFDKKQPQRKAQQTLRNPQRSSLIMKRNLNNVSLCSEYQISYCACFIVGPARSGGVPLSCGAISPVAAYCFICYFYCLIIPGFIQISFVILFASFYSKYIKGLGTFYASTTIYKVLMVYPFLISCTL